MGMPEPLDVWLGKDEVEGVPSQPRKDLKPPPTWRLEAVAATERPRSLTMGADGRTAVFIQDRDTSDVWLLELDGDGCAPPQRAHDGPRSDAVLGGHRAAALAGLLHRRLRRPGQRVGRRRRGWAAAEARRGGEPGVARQRPPRRLGRARRHVASRGARRRRRVAAASAAASGEDGGLEDYGDEWGAAVSPDGTAVAFVFTPRHDLLPERDPRRRRRDRRGAGAHRHRPDHRQGTGMVTGRLADRLQLGAQRLVRAPPDRRRRRRRAAAHERRGRLHGARLVGRRRHDRGSPLPPQPLRPRHGRRRNG